MSRTNGDYLYAYSGHRSLNDTNNSPQNTLAAIQEFQNRSAYDTEVDFIFLSNLWDIERFTVRICIYFYIMFHIRLVFICYIFYYIGQIHKIANDKKYTRFLAFRV